MRDARFPSMDETGVPVMANRCATPLRKGQTRPAGRASYVEPAAVADGDAYRARKTEGRHPV